MIKMMKILFLSQSFQELSRLGTVATVSIIFFEVDNDDIERHFKILKIGKKMIKIIKVPFFKSKFPKDRVILAWNGWYNQYYIF